VVIFADDFNRTSTSTFGAPVEFADEPWTARDHNNDDVAIAGGRLRLRDGGARAARLDVSTLGFEHIVLTYTWRPIRKMDSRDFLLVRSDYGGELHRLGGVGGAGPLSFTAGADNLENVCVLVLDPGERIRRRRLHRQRRSQWRSDHISGARARDIRSHDTGLVLLGMTRRKSADRPKAARTHPDSST
jgi:hypothetical protein